MPQDIGNLEFANDNEENKKSLLPIRDNELIQVKMDT